MARLDPSAVTQKIYALLNGATPAERQMIVAATLTLFGDKVVTSAVVGGAGVAR